MSYEEPGRYYFDLDRTLAFYDKWRGETHIGAPIKSMVDLVKLYLSEGKQCWIFTARVATGDQGELEAVRGAINEWTLEHIGQVLPITCEKSQSMVVLYDDRCIQVEPNTGRLIGDQKD